MNEVDAYSRLAGVYDDIVVDPCFSSWADFLGNLWSLDSHPVTTVLDVCCGTGLLAAELASRGYEVTGLDASAAMLDRARALLGDDVRLVHRRLPEIGLDGPFDAAVSTYDGLNYLDPGALRGTLIGLAAIIRSGGWLVFDLHTDTLFQLAIDNPVVTLDWEGTSVEIAYEADAHARTCRSTITMSDAEGSFTEAHDQFIHADADVRAALSAAGFDRIAVLDNYSLTTAGPATLRATWVARRPDAPVPGGATALHPAP